MKNVQKIKNAKKHKELVAIAKILSSKNPVIRKLLACKNESEFDSVYSKLTQEEKRIIDSF